MVGPPTTLAVYVGLAIVLELNPVTGLQEYVTTGSPPTTEVVKASEDPLQTEAVAPFVMVTIGLPNVIPVKAEVCPETRVAVTGPSALPPSAPPLGAGNLIQGLVDTSNKPRN